MRPKEDDRQRITALLRNWQAGDAAALEQLMPAVHAELRRIARHHMRGENRGHTLQPTALVNEVYLRLLELNDMSWQDRAHFFAMASRLMRRVLVDAARARGADKRGQGFIRVTLNDALLPGSHALDLRPIDEALTALAAVDARKARVVELKFFGGLTVEEIAAALGVSVETVARDWRSAKVWLKREISRSGAA